MPAGKALGSKGQGALEYLLLIGGAVLIAAVAITLITTSGSSGANTAKAAQSTYGSSLEGMNYLLYDCPSFSSPTTFNVFIIRADAPGSYTDPVLLSNSIKTVFNSVPAKPNLTINVNEITSISATQTLTSLNYALDNAPERSVFINAHGQSIPISPVLGWASSFDFIANKINGKKYVWVSTAGYPFYCAGNNSEGESCAPGEGGMRAFLEDFWPMYSASVIPQLVNLSFWNPGSANGTSRITMPGKAFARCWGITMPETLPAQRMVPANANPNPNQVFYTDIGNGYQTVEFIKMGNGYFAHSGVDPRAQVGDENMAKVAVLTALQAASLNR